MSNYGFRIWTDFSTPFLGFVGLLCCFLYLLDIGEITNLKSTNQDSMIQHNDIQVCYWQKQKITNLINKPIFYYL